MKWAAILASCLVLGACKREALDVAERCSPAASGTPVDAVLLAFLSRARSAHHIADEREAAGDLVGATTPLSALTTGPFPRASGALAPEVREVLADTRARLADLHSRQGAFELALGDIRAGLEQATDPNYFRGHLLETEGLVEERRAKALEHADPVKAAAARARAIDLLEQAMALQAAVIDTTVPTTPSAGNSTDSGTPAAEPSK